MGRPEVIAARVVSLRKSRAAIQRRAQISRAYVEELETLGQRGPGAFLLAQRALHDIQFRLRVIDEYGDYRQVLTPVPGMLVFGSLSQSGPTAGEVVRRNNAQMAEMVSGHPDRFAGFVAATPVTDPDAATEEAIRSVRDLSALGVQLEEDAINLPLHEDRYDPLFAAMEELGAGCGCIRSERRRHPGHRLTPLRSCSGRCSDGRSTRRSRSRGWSARASMTAIRT